MGIEDGVGISGRFYDGNRLLASGEFLVDIAGGVFEAELGIPRLNFGPVELSQVVIDVRLAAGDSHYLVAGTAELIGVSVSMEGEIRRAGFRLTGQAEVDISGFEATAEFIIDPSGIRFSASAGGEVFESVKTNVTSKLRAAANLAQEAVDSAQSAVAKMRGEVQSLEQELDEARAEAQEEIDRIKKKLDDAGVIVDRARAAKDYWYSQKVRRYRSWQSAQANTRRAPWYKKPYYKGIEAARYASYRYGAARYSLQVGVYHAARVGYNAVREAAGWALDTAGVEASPNVIRLKALIAGAKVALHATELVLESAEEVNQGVLKALEIADSLKVRQITFRGELSANAGISLTIDYSFRGKSHSLSLDSSLENLGSQLTKEFLAIVF